MLGMIIVPSIADIFATKNISSTLPLQPNNSPQCKSISAFFEIDDYG
jgi:hypothetical protein